jgi:hypothetical protein
LGRQINGADNTDHAIFPAENDWKTHHVLITP